MNLPEMDDKNAFTAIKIRKALLPAMTGFLDGPHYPPLEQNEKDAIINRIIGYMASDTRSRFWCNLERQLRPNVKDGIVILTPTMLKWAGRIKPDSKNTDPSQRIKHAANGRIIRSAKGL